MPTKDELEKENAELKAQLEALQRKETGRWFVRNHDLPGGPPVAVCFDVFEQAQQDGRWCMDTDEEAP